MMATTVNDDGLKTGLFASATVHFLFLLLLYFGLPFLMPPPPEHHVPVPFQIVELADLTNTRVKDPAPVVKPPEPSPPKPEVKPPQPAPQPQSLPTPAPKPEENVEAIKPAPKPKPPEPVKPKTDDFQRLLKNLEQKRVVTPKPETRAETKQAATPAASQAPSLSDRLTISEEDLLRRQIEQCWNMPIGARNAQTLVVQISIDVNPDRSVQHAEIVDKSHMTTDPFYRAAAEAALRALYDPRCSPLELPADKYQQWKHIDFTFDPRDMQ